mmetsp:Transcript_44943/g.74586  ORF Transcript_44943/g.74586 Transcript_44943/m.74586 type:complete len:224 (-) Transcript_44943:293-964(-)
MAAIDVPQQQGEEAATCYEDLAVCAVCGEGDWEDDNAIIFCDSCDLAVHQVCYGAGARHIPEGDQPWFCDVCRHLGSSSRAGRYTKKGATLQTHQKECIMCPDRGGALKRTTDSRWAHITCALWVPGVQFLDVEGRDVIHPFGVHEKRLDLVCSICEKHMGACIQCKAPRCLTAFHATCARRKGLHMVEKEKDDYVDFAAYCDKHRPASTLQKKKRRRREMKW